MSSMSEGQGDCGFTLLEVMIALAVISIGLMALLGSQSQGLSLANETRFNTTASLLAQAQMAEVEARALRDLTSDSGDFGEDFPDYVWRFVVEDVVLEGAERLSRHLKRIDLEVSHTRDPRYRCRLTLYRFLQ